MDDNGWDCSRNLSSSHSLMWKHISQIGSSFFSFTRFVLGDGKKNQILDGPGVG